MRLRGTFHARDVGVRNEHVFIYKVLLVEQLLVTGNPGKIGNVVFHVYDGFDRRVRHWEVGLCGKGM